MKIIRDWHTRYKERNARYYNERRDKIIVTLRSGHVLTFDKVAKWSVESDNGVVTSFGITQDVSCLSRFGFVSLADISSVQESGDAL